MKPKVTFSVVIPLYNNEHFIGRALESIIGQGYPPYEIIVVDDGSTDRSADIVKQFADPRLCLFSQKNSGVSAARNKGIKEAKGDITAFLDADDQWYPHFLETIKRLNKEYPEAGAYATAYELAFTDGIRIKSKCLGIPEEQWDGILQRYFQAALSYAVWSSAIAIRREVFDVVGFFLVGMHMSEDLDLWARIALQYPIAYNNKVSSIYYKNFKYRSKQDGFSITLSSFVPRLEKRLDDADIPKGMIQDYKKYIAYHKMQVAWLVFRRSGDSVLLRKQLHECLPLLERGWNQAEKYFLKCYIGSLLPIRIIEMLDWKTNTDRE